MSILLVFGISLFFAVLISGIAERSILSTAVIFLVVGLVTGGGALGDVGVRPDNDFVVLFAELALISVLFNDGMRTHVRELVAEWILPSRALLIGLPLTMLFTALLAMVILQLSWTKSLLIAAVLSPTDPLFAAALIGRQNVPWRLRHMLNVESGFNDGLALPIVIILIGLLQEEPADPTILGMEVVLGLIVGVFVPMILVWVERQRIFPTTTRVYAPFDGFAIGIIVLSVASLAQVNIFLAAFAGGITVATIAPAVKDRFHMFGEHVTELLKLGVLLIFGALVTPAMFTQAPRPEYQFALVTVAVTRLPALLIALLGTELTWRERLAAGWFGPKGFASVVYGVLVLHAAIPTRLLLFRPIAFTIIASILLHSSTDVIVARWFGDDDGVTDEIPISVDEVEEEIALPE